VRPSIAIVLAVLLGAILVASIVQFLLLGR